ncbi:hypothetical protein BVG19_g2113 [[Candida] boidinii]|nr:hypothetical protein BVG19_g2113 [[Candida] boidinii]OWB51772.1 hypothetical protein B5S27_g3340 [[Candida] boidinii]
MSSSFQTRRTQKSAINTPVASHVVAEKSLSKKSAQIILDTFIENCETISNSSLNLSALQTNNVIVSKSAPYTGPNSTTVSQLKRLQRELRGLPPLLAEGYSAAGTRPSTEGSTTVNKKTVFDEQPKQNKKITFDDEPKQNKKITFDDEPSQNKKITFDDEPKTEIEAIETKEEEKEEDEDDEEEEEESQPVDLKEPEIKEESKEEKPTIDKEERKRLKKERKKEEKKRRKLELESK